MKKNKRYYLFQMDAMILSLLSTVLFIVLLIIGAYTSFELLALSIDKLFGMNLLLFLVIFFGYLFIHELLHSLAYVLYGGKYNKIIYGIALEKGILYCLCKQNISKNNILHSLMYPLFFIGIVTLVISIIFNLPILYLLSIFNLSGCTGDIIMFIYISRLDKNIEFTEMDDPISFAIYSDKDVSKINHFGLNYLGAKDSVERKDFTKIIVSKQSKTVLIILIILGLIELIVL